MSKNVTAITNSPCRLFVVINVPTSFHLQKLQNPSANRRARPQQVNKTTLIRKTAKRRKRRDIKSSLLLRFDNSFSSTKSIPTSMTVLKILNACEGFKALPSSLGHGSRSYIPLSGSLVSGVRHTFIYPFSTMFCLPWGTSMYKVYFWYNRWGDSCSVLQILLQKILWCSISDTPEVAVFF